MSVKWQVSLQLVVNDLRKEKIMFTKGKEVWMPNCGDYESFVKRNQIMSNIITVLNTLVTSEIEKINEGEIYDFNLVDFHIMVIIIIILTENNIYCSTVGIKQLSIL